MKTSTRRYLIAALVVLVIVLAYWWWTRGAVKLAISGVSPGTDAGSLVLTVLGTSPVMPAKWVGKQIKIVTQSLGTIKTTVAAQSVTSGTGNVPRAGTVMTAAGAYTGGAAYAPAAGDYARISLVFY